MNSESAMGLSSLCFLACPRQRRKRSSSIISQLNISVTDALFESISGLTTTGATVISAWTIFPNPYFLQATTSMAWWHGHSRSRGRDTSYARHRGMQYTGRNPWPCERCKLSPRIAETAKALWLIYLSLPGMRICLLDLWHGSSMPSVTHFQPLRLVDFLPTTPR